MLGWVAEFEAALGSEFGTNPRVAALATADPDGHPYVRFVVCRRVDPDGAIWIASDGRSGKNRQVRQRPVVELAVWLPCRREQFRVAGGVDLLVPGRETERCRSLWESMSDAARAPFFWPEPGELRTLDNAAFAASVPSEWPMPITFEVLCLIPRRVEHLSLSVQPQRRRRWRIENGWKDEEINP